MDQPTQTPKPMSPEITPSKRTPLPAAQHFAGTHRQIVNVQVADPLLEPGETELELPAKTGTLPPKRPVIAPISPKSELQPETPSNFAAEQAATPPEPDAAKQPGGLPSSPDQAAGEHQQQIREHINSRTFFVPINTTARKRSLTVSAGMTVLLVLLGLILIDLMLDSGIILLLQKIPHTHFFDTSA